MFRALADALANRGALANNGALVVTGAQTQAAIGSSRYQRLEEADGGSAQIGWTFLARSRWRVGAPTPK